MTTLLPRIISDYMAASDSGNVDAIVMCFTDDAVVFDEDQEWRGRAGIREWRERVATAYEYTVEVRGSASPGRVDGLERHDVYTHLERKDFEPARREAKRSADMLFLSPPHRCYALAVKAQAELGLHLEKEALASATEAYEMLGSSGSIDRGAAVVRLAYAEALGANLAIVAKERKSATVTEALYLIGEVKDRDRFVERDRYG